VAIAGARPFLQFRVDRVMAAAELGSAEGRARAADAALSAVAEHPDELVRDQYVMQIADRCRLEAALVRDRLEKARRSPPKPSGERPGARRGTARESEGEARRMDDGDPGPIPPDDEGPGQPRPERPRDPSTRPGLEALRLAVHRPEEVADRLEGVLFEDPVQRAAFEVLSEAESLHEAIEESPGDVADLLRRLAVEEPVTDEDTIGDPFDAVVYQLVRVATHHAMGELQVATRASGTGLAEATAEVAQVRHWLDELDDPDASRAASDRLVAWLVVRGSAE
jgi:DNA primase